MINDHKHRTVHNYLSQFPLLRVDDLMQAKGREKKVNRAGWRHSYITEKIYMNEKQMIYENLFGKRRYRTAPTLTILSPKNKRYLQNNNNRALFML